jgi:hypothetical protein
MIIRQYNSASNDFNGNHQMFDLLSHCLLFINNLVYMAGSSFLL